MAVSKSSALKSALKSEGNDPSVLELLDRLDSLWTTYLQYLDEYTEAQKQIQEHMSAGFLSLARANFNARDGVRRFGKDFYHEKAVASRRVQLSSTHQSARPQLSVAKWTDPDPVGTSDLEEGNGEDGLITPEPKQQPSPSSSPTPVQDDSDGTSSDEAPEQDPETHATDSYKQPPLPMDPLRWFGVLVPPTLRSAQSSFLHATDNGFASAINAARAMRDVEYEIRKLRKEIKKAEAPSKNR